MTYEEVKEIKRRLHEFGKPLLLFDVRLDNTSEDEYPKFYYFDVEIQLGEEDKETTVVELLIDEDPKESEIRLEKCDYDSIDEKYEQEQQRIYDACKQIVRDYLDGTLINR